MKYLLIGLVAMLPAFSSAGAQENRDIRVRVGLGAQLRPQFPGSDHTSVSPLVKVKIAHGTNEFAFTAPDDSPGIAITSSDGFSFGPAVNLIGRRKESDVGAPVGSIKRTIEVGAFAQYEWKDSFRVRGELLKGVNGSKGVAGTISLDKIWRDGDHYIISLGPRVLFSDGRYERAYFGVTPDVALRTGLPVFRPHSGIYGVAVASGVSYALNDHWGLFGYARYERLVGDAGKSPIVRELGSRNQMSGGIGLHYTFTIHRAPKAQAQ